MALDPVCGMTVDRAKAVTREIDGETVFFCSEHCAHGYDPATSPGAPVPAAASHR